MSYSEFQEKTDLSRYLSNRINSITVTMQELLHQYDTTKDDTYYYCLLAIETINMKQYSEEFQLKLERSCHLNNRINSITVTMDELQHQFDSTNDNTYSNCLLQLAEKLQQEYKDLRKDYSKILTEKNIDSLFIDLDRIDFTLGCG